MPTKNESPGLRGAALFDVSVLSLVGAAAFGERLLGIALWVTILIVLVGCLRGHDQIPRAELVASRRIVPR